MQQVLKFYMHWRGTLSMAAPVFTCNEMEKLGLYFHEKLFHQFCKAIVL